MHTRLHAPRFARLRNPQRLEEGLVEIVIDLAGHGWRSMAFEWVESGVAEQDEARAFDTASKLPGVDPREWRAIVELARARAHVLLERADFQAAHAALVPVLLEQRVLAGEEVEEICREAIDKLAAAPSLMESPSAPNPVEDHHNRARVQRS